MPQDYKPTLREVVKWVFFLRAISFLYGIYEQKGITKKGEFKKGEKRKKDYKHRWMLSSGFCHGGSLLCMAYEDLAFRERFVVFFKILGKVVTIVARESGFSIVVFLKIE